MEDGFDQRKRDIFLEIPEQIPDQSSIEGFSEHEREILNRAQHLITRFSEETFEPPQDASEIKCIYVPRALRLGPTDPFRKELSAEIVDPRLMMLEPIYALALDQMQGVDTTLQRGQYTNNPKYKGAKTLVMALDGITQVMEKKCKWAGPFTSIGNNGELRFVMDAPFREKGCINLNYEPERNCLKLEVEERNLGITVDSSEPSEVMRANIRIDREKGETELNVEAQIGYWTENSYRRGKIFDKMRKSKNLTHEIYGDKKHHLRLCQGDANSIINYLLPQFGAENLKGLTYEDIDNFPDFKDIIHERRFLMNNGK